MPDETITIGNLKLKAYAAKKPIGVSPNGTFLTLQDIEKKPELVAGSLLALDEGLQAKLAIERNTQEPDFRLGIFGVGSFSRNEIVEEIRAGTELGRSVVRAEMNYCNDLIGTIAARKTPVAPKIPEPTAEPLPGQWSWLPKQYWWGGLAPVSRKPGTRSITLSAKAVSTWRTGRPTTCRFA